MVTSKKRFKKFTGGSDKPLPPLSFEVYDEEFFAHGAIQGKTLINLVKKSRSDDPADQADLIEEFFQKALTPESLERWNTLQDDPEKIVDVELLGEIVGWLVEEYTNRPEELPAS